MMCCRYAFSSHMYYLHILPAFIIIVYHRHIVPSNITIMFSSFNSITRSNHIFPGVPGHIGAPRWFSRKSSARAILRRALGHQGRVRCHTPATRVYMYNVIYIYICIYNTWALGGGLPPPPPSSQVLTTTGGGGVSPMQPQNQN
jgi:hypothetical protein